MSKLESILAVVPTERRLSPAVHRAIAYARRSQARLHLCLFDHYGPIDYAGRVFGAEVAERARRDFLEERSRWLAEQARGLAEQGLRVECDVAWAPRRYEAIIGKILETQADLVVKDVANDPAAGTLLPDASDWKLLRLAPAPLMLVRPQARLVPHHLLAAVDVTVGEEGEALNEAIVDAARQYAAFSDAALELVSVFSYVPVEAFGAGFIADSYEIMDSAHKEALARFATQHKIPASHIKRRVNLDVAAGIAEAARDAGADLLVLGSAYHSGFEKLMFGTTAEALLRRASCDALMVKPAGFVHELARHLDLDKLRERYAGPVAAAA